MWSICRVDNQYPTEADPSTFSLFGVQWGHRKCDLDITAARESGFVGPDDELVIVSPSGKVTEAQ